MKNSIYQIVAISALGLHLVPLLIVLGKKLWSAVPFRLLALYWLLCALVNALPWLPLQARILELCTLIYKLLDIPLVLSVLYYSAASAAVKKFTRFAAPALLAASLVNCIIRGFTMHALNYVLGVGLLVVISTIIWEIILKLQQIKLTSQAKGLLLTHAALLFVFGANAVIYIFVYFLPGTSSATDNLLMYYLSALIALPVTIGGYLIRGVKPPPPAKEQLDTPFGKGYQMM